MVTQTYMPTQFDEHAELKLTIVHTSACVHRDMKHAGSLKIFFSRDLFADVLSVYNRNIKHALAIEFD